MDGRRAFQVLALCAASTSGCVHGAVVPFAERAPAEAAAIEALRASRFDDAEKEAGRLIEQHPNYAEARAVRATCRWQRAVLELYNDGRTIAVAAAIGGVNAHYLAVTIEAVERRLAEVEADLEVAAKSPDFALELCPACWEADWNQDGRIEDEDRRLLEVELDADMQPLPSGDPRRRPTFRFDVADLDWARAMVAFVRATLQLMGGYDWTPVGGRWRRGADHDRLVIKVSDRARTARAKALFAEGLELAERARREILAETDDDREWLPNPRQRSHPLPLPVDDALFETWRIVLSDLGRLLRSEEGLALSSLALLGEKKLPADLPGFLDLGRFLGDPSDIVFDPAALEGTDSKRVLVGLFGRAYVESMRPSELPGRLERMKSEVDAGKESLARKLRYLFWLN
jgi:hypothetical protein